MELSNSILTWTWGDIVVTQHKSFEYQFEFGSRATRVMPGPFEFSIKVTAKRNHAGPSFTFGIAGLFWLCLKVYDHRHWDDENDCWSKPAIKEK